MAGPKMMNMNFAVLEFDKIINRSAFLAVVQCIYENIYV